MQQTLLEQYLYVTSENDFYVRNRQQWQFLLESYAGGDDYTRGQHLTKYVNKTNSEYAARLTTTHLENHCKSVISTYISFLFRELS